MRLYDFVFTVSPDYVISCSAPHRLPRQVDLHPPISDMQLMFLVFFRLVKKLVDIYPRKLARAVPNLCAFDGDLLHGHFCVRGADARLVWQYVYSMRSPRSRSVQTSHANRLSIR